MTQPPVLAPAPEMSRKEVHEVLFGLLSALFVAIVSATIVATALPTIIGDLEGTQTQYTWVVTASLLTMTVSGPLWSKLSDLYDKKLLVQSAIVIFLLGSLAAGLVNAVPPLLAARAVQGLGMGGLVALSQSIIGTIIAPRERGRYSGWIAATMAVATVSGPVLGGIIVDLWGWRWCFFATIPFSLFALGMLRKFLHLHHESRPVKIDWWGSVFISIAASLPMIWVSFAGSSYAWLSLETGWFAVGTLAALAALVWIERRHPEPLVPPRIVMERTTMLAILASIAVGVAQFGSSVFLAQYFQVARGHTPTAAGLLMLPMVIGSMIGSAGSGAFITRTGEWKRPVVLGSVVLLGGLLLMGSMDHGTPMWLLGIYMVLVGLGTGMLMQNIVLVVQNTVDVAEVGVASGVVTFFRSMGGAVGVAVLGALLAASVHDRIAAGLTRLGVPAGSGMGENLDLASLPEPVLHLVRTSYADATGEIFLISGIATVLTLVTVVLMPRTELRTTIEKVDAAD